MRRYLNRTLRGRLGEALRIAKRYKRDEQGPFLADLPPGSRWLVIAPHPDDEAIGCGGTMAKGAAAGKEVTVLFLTGGEHGNPGEDPDLQLAARRREEARSACGILRTAEPVFWDLPDLGVKPAAEAVARMQALLAELGSETIFCPSPFERHPDHVGAFEILRDALAGRDADCWLYEVWSPLFSNYGVDITSFGERKAAAIRAYPSQLRNVDYVEKNLGMNAFRSLTYPGVRYAEAFLRMNGKELAGLEGMIRKGGPGAGVCP